MTDTDKKAQYRANWQDERNSAALYRAIAEVEKNPQLKSVYQRLGETEEKHSHFWEAKLRAAVALGRAGDASGLELLKTMAATPRVELGTATALARLGDPSAVPSLSRALGLTALRVEAALALRKLGTDVDLLPLANALSSGDELSRVTAAEALLILAGEAG